MIYNNMVLLKLRIDVVNDNISIKFKKGDSFNAIPFFQNMLVSLSKAPYSHFYCVCLGFYYC